MFRAPDHLAFPLLALAISCRIGGTDGSAAPGSQGAPAPSCDHPNCPDTAGVASIATNADPTHQIRFDTAAGADDRRAMLVDYIWGHPLPDTVPVLSVDATRPFGMDDVDEDVTGRVDVLDATIADTDIHALSYVLRPVTPLAGGARFVILHQGHTTGFDEGGLGSTANFLLQQGFTVIAMHMPTFGWNGWGRDRWKNHTAMFDGLSGADLGRVFRYFLEPIVQNVTWALASSPDVRDVSILGISGGGWAASMAGAVDPRLSVSVEVAGSAPLYARNGPGDLGDREQYEASLYGEDIAPDGTGGGITTWLEIYTLAGYGPGRQAIQVHNELDPCCFAGNIADSYASIVSDRVHDLGAGSWTNVIDVGESEHEVSDFTTDVVLAHALGIANGTEGEMAGEPGPTVK
jgi:hypothetical protein